MKESLRDKTRDNLVAILNLIGVRAELSERGAVEEKVENSWYQRSLGRIDIHEGQIRWINILKKDGSQHSPPKWWIVMGIPDDRLSSNQPKIKIKTIRKKTFPLFGKVVDVVWRGEDGGTALVKKLSSDEDIKVLAKDVGTLEIKSQSDSFNGWTLTLDRRLTPSIKDWNSFEKIAGYILSSPRFL